MEAAKKARWDLTNIGRVLGWKVDVKSVKSLRMKSSSFSTYEYMYKIVHTPILDTTTAKNSILLGDVVCMVVDIYRSSQCFSSHY